MRLPIGSFAKRGDVAGRTVDRGVGVREMARRSPEFLEVERLKTSASGVWERRRRHTLEHSEDPSRPGLLCTRLPVSMVLAGLHGKEKGKTYLE
jgi:hypothetical protein